MKISSPWPQTAKCGMRCLLFAISVLVFSSTAIADVSGKANKLYVQAHMNALEAEDVAKDSYSKAYALYKTAADKLDSILTKYPGSDMAVRVINDELRVGSSSLSHFRSKTLPKYERLAALETRPEQLKAAWAEYALDRAGNIAQKMLESAGSLSGDEQLTALILSQSYLDSAMLLLESEVYRYRYDNLVSRLELMSYRGLIGGELVRLAAERGPLQRSLFWPYVLAINAAIASRTGDSALADELCGYTLQVYERLYKNDTEDEEKLTTILTFPRSVRALVKAGCNEQLAEFLEDKVTSIGRSMERILAEEDKVSDLNKQPTIFLWLPATTMALAWTDDSKHIESLIGQIKRIAVVLIGEQVERGGGNNARLAEEAYSRALSILVSKTLTIAGLSAGDSEGLTADDKRLLQRMVEEEPDEAWYLYYVVALQGFPSLVLDAQKTLNGVQSALMFLATSRALDMRATSLDHTTAHRLVRALEQRKE